MKNTSKNTYTTISRKGNGSLYMNPSFKASKKEEEDSFEDKHLGYQMKTMNISCMVVNIDEPIIQPSYYRMVVNAIDELDENSELVLKISSPGGYLSGLEVLLSAINRTEADTTAVIDGEAHSAASMLALSCNNVVVSPYASMLIHNVSFSSGGKASDITRHVAHVDNTAKILFRDIYTGFLTDEEIEQCFNGIELWLNAELIVERLKKRVELNQAKLKEEQGEGGNSTCDTCCEAEGCQGCDTYEEELLEEEIQKKSKKSKK